MDQKLHNNLIITSQSFSWMMQVEVIYFYFLCCLVPVARSDILCFIESVTSSVVGTFEVKQF